MNCQWPRFFSEQYASELEQHEQNDRAGNDEGGEQLQHGFADPA
jgi:hypothetical protein